MWLESIKSRKSIRTYEDRILEKPLEQEIMDFLNNCQGPFEPKAKFYFIDIEEVDNKNLGTYGVIKGAKNFIAASIRREPRSLEQLGYVLEKGILYANSLGLGTCWLAGTFKRQEFIKTINLEEKEYLPVITPIGYPRDKRSFVDSFMRIAAGSKNRKEFKDLFFEGNWNSSLVNKEFSKALEMVRLAPSASNKQPWRVLVLGNKYNFYLDRNKGYGEALGYDVQKIDMGIAMCHFDVAMEELGFKGDWIDENPKIDGETYEYISTFKIN